MVVLFILGGGIILAFGIAPQGTPSPTGAPPVEESTITLSASVSPSGGGSVTPSSGQYQQGDRISVSASPSTGYKFSYWSGDASGTALAITVTMDSAKTLVAHFTETAPPAEEEPTQEGIQVFQNRQPPYSKGGGGMINLVNNKNARDPTWQELVSFLRADKTDGRLYVFSLFMCGDFAEQLHNNAEAAGIRAAWVAVDYADSSAGHALNVFETVDRDLVYVDCTGKGYIPTWERLEDEKTYGKAKSWDRIAYVEIEKVYGIISLEAVSCFSYVCYTEWSQRLQSFDSALDEYNRKVIAHNAEVNRYNEWVTGRILYEGTSDAIRAQQWHEELGRQETILNRMAAELDGEGSSLGAFWEPLGVVKSVEVYW